MKKIYITPKTRYTEVNLHEVLLAGSNFSIDEKEIPEAEETEEFEVREENDRFSKPDVWGDLW